MMMAGITMFAHLARARGGPASCAVAVADRADRASMMMARDNHVCASTRAREAEPSYGVAVADRLIATA